MQKIISHKQDLLTENGCLNVDGYSKKMIVNYNKENVKNKKRLKEWDYYYIGDSRLGLCLTISDISYAGVLSASVVDFVNRKHYDQTSLVLFPKEKVELPLTSESGTSHFKTKKAEFTFVVQDGKRHLKGFFKQFYKKENKDLEFDIVLDCAPEESIVKVTPFKNKKHFYFNQKINTLPANGFFTFKGKKYTFSKETALATLDWGRGVLPYNTKWYWASMNCQIYGTPVGFNFGKALGNNSEATENMIFFNGKAHKIGVVDINIQRRNKKRDYLGEWTFYSDDGRVELVFEPILDRYVPFNIGVLAFVPHQVFGYYSGKLVLDDGTTINLDKKLGFSERVVNRW